MGFVEVVDMSKQKKKVGAPERKLTMEELEKHMDSRGVPNLPNNGTISAGLSALVEEYENGKSNDLTNTRNGLFAIPSASEALLVMYAKSGTNPNSGTPWKNSVEVLSETIDEYFMFCSANRITPTVAGVCSWLGISVATMRNWAKNPNMQDKYALMERAVSFIHAITEGGAVEGSVPAHVFRILGTNYWRLNDTADIEVSLKNPLEELQKDEILNSIPDVSRNFEENLINVTPEGGELDDDLL